MSIPYKEKLCDPLWQKKRLEILQRDRWACFWCGDTKQTLHIHHEVYFGLNPWETPDFCLKTLCKECHEIEHLPLTVLEKILISSLRNKHIGEFDTIKLLNKVIKSNYNG